jgi:Uma2 family endonuclease
MLTEDNAMTAVRKPDLMTVTEFQSWQPDHSPDGRWLLVDGVPVCMAPASENHGRIQAAATTLLMVHLEANRPGCAVVVAPGVIPRIRSMTNERVPDLGVTCTPPAGSHAIVDPVLLIEILSPSNASITRNNVWAYTTIPSVQEILLLRSTGIDAELLRRDAAGDWPPEPMAVGPQDDVTLACIGFQAPLISFYRTTNLLPS